jgi:hypothetical protein
LWDFSFSPRGNPLQAAIPVLRNAIDLGLSSYLAEENHKPRTTEGLAKKAGANPVLMDIA